MKHDHNKVGSIGEDVATKYLQKEGFSIIERNYNRKWGEIDIVCSRNKKLHFVEVKSVSRENVTHETSDFRPEEKVDGRKRARLRRAIETWLSERGVSCETLFQVDLLVVFLNLATKEAGIKEVKDIII